MPKVISSGLKTAKNNGKRKKRPRTRTERLQLKEGKLRRELEETLKEIREDTLKRGQKDSLNASDRQKLANRSTIIRSKILRLQDEIETRYYVKDDKDSKLVKNKIDNRYAAAARQHNRLLRMTAELERLKQDEEDIRAIANDEFRLETRPQNKDVMFTDEDPNSIKRFKRRKTLSGISRISATNFRHSTSEMDERAVEREDRLENIRESLSEIGIETPQQKLEKADGLGHKYDLMREMRNLTHGQMISRMNKNSYWRINPPYRRKPKRFEHVRRAYARDVYENKVDVMQARDKNVVSPRKEIAQEIKKKEREELPRFTMSSGRTISVKKMKDFTPPGMTLTPVEC